MTHEPRREVELALLDVQTVAAEPIGQVRAWLDEALGVELLDGTAMTLATVGADGRPSARVVLLKALDERGFCFFTNYQSRKGRELEAQPHAALVWWWPALQRQLRAEGPVARMAAAESDQYYGERPLESRLGAWASPQSRVIESRAVLDDALADARRRFGDAPPRPPWWGGYRLSPIVVELWQERSSRLHDRIRYRLDGGRWLVERLAP